MTQPERDLPALADGFDLAPGYLDTATMGVPPRLARAALEREIGAWARGEASAAAYDEWVDRARAAFARMLGVEATSVAVGPQVSPFMADVAAGLRSGEEVVAYREDFTSLLFPLLVREDLRVRLVDLDELADAVSPRTAVVAVSAVQSADGAVADLDAIAAAARDNDALTVVDATQACGWMPLEASSFDVVVAGAYKWLLGARGSALMTAGERARERLVPVSAGWYSGADPWSSIYGAPLRLAADARRFDISPGWLCWIATAPALELIERIGVDAIYRHDLGLANRLRAALGEEPGDSAIVALRTPGAASALERAGIRAAWRADAVRLAFHLYNTADDADRAAAALLKARPR